MGHFLEILIVSGDNSKDKKIILFPQWVTSNIRYDFPKKVSFYDWRFARLAVYSYQMLLFCYLSKFLHFDPYKAKDPLNWVLPQKGRY